MKLSELFGNHPTIKIIRDGEFDMLGMGTTVYSEENVLTFLESEKFLEQVQSNPNVTCIICHSNLVGNIELPDHIGLVASDSPRLDFYQSHNKLAGSDFYWEKFENKIHPSANIHPTAVLYDHSIEIGEGCLIEANVVLHPGTIIGKNCVIRSGSQIGTSGFQFMKYEDQVISVESGGRVIIEDYVEIQHLTCIDRGAFGGDTLIKKHARIDNLCHIAHDDVIGERTFVVAGTTLGGRVVIGDDAWTGINATISNGISVGNNSTISLGAVVTKDVDSGETVTGNFAIDHKKFLEHLKKIR